MDYLSLDMKDLFGMEFNSASDVEISTWLHLLRYCAQQENGGVIAGARNWSKRAFNGTISVPMDRVEEGSSLWSWEGNDLVVFAYPTALEAGLKNKRIKGKESAEKRWRNQKHQGYEGSVNGSPIELPIESVNGCNVKQVEASNGVPNACSVVECSKVECSVGEAPTHTQCDGNLTESLKANGHPTEEEWRRSAEMEGMCAEAIRSEWLNQARQLEPWKKVRNLRLHAAWLLQNFRVNDRSGKVAGSLENKNSAPAAQVIDWKGLKVGGGSNE